MAQSTKQSRRTERPQSVIALNFSSALDDLFKLNGLGALEDAVEQKRDSIQTKQVQLQSLDSKLREAEERLRKLEIKYRRQSQMLATRRMTLPIREVVQQSSESETEEDSAESDNRDSSRSPPKKRQH